MNKVKLQFNKNAKLPIILQDEITECGHACIVMISNFWGHSLDLYTLRKLYKPSSYGVTLLHIKYMLEKLGFIARALKITLEELDQIKTPAILHWNMNHFVVLKYIKKGIAIIHDPALGIKTCNYKELSQSFTGVVLEVDKTINFTPIKVNNKLTLFDVVKSIYGIRKYLILLLLLSSVIEILNLLNPIFLQYVADNIISLSNSNNLFIIAGLFVIIILIQTLISYIRGSMLIYLANNLLEQFSTNLIKHLLSLPLDFFEKRHSGDIQSKFQAIDQIQRKISIDFVNSVLDGMMVILNLIIMFIYSRILTFVVILSLCCCFIIRQLSFKSLKKHTEISIMHHAKSASIFLENLRNILSIKTFLKEEVRLTAWRNNYINALNSDIKASKLQNNYSVLNQLILYLEPVLLLCMASFLVLNNKFSIGMLLAFLAYRLLLVNKASLLIQNWMDYKLISIQLSRVSDILLQDTECKENNNLTILPMQIKYALTLKNVSYKYHNDERVILNKINLQINAGEKVVVTGPSGCGKTTLLKIMMGLLTVTMGDIYIDTFNINDFGLKNYRSLTAAVMQQDLLLSGSILDNITFFDESLDIEWVITVAKFACIHDTINKLPMRYETLIGEMGTILSGGQKQRILLARALYKKPKILFLDEASSYLDIENERKVNENLKSLDITQVIVAHRSETIQMADRVIDLGLINQI